VVGLLLVLPSGEADQFGLMHNVLRQGETVPFRGAELAQKSNQALHRHLRGRKEERLLKPKITKQVRSTPTRSPISLKKYEHF